MSSCLDCIFEIHQLWQSSFSRVYSNCCCSCSFEREIIKTSQSSHKMYSNNILDFQESTTILNAYTKSLETYWRHHISVFILSVLPYFLSSFSCLLVFYQFIVFSSFCSFVCIMFGLLFCLSVSSVFFKTFFISFSFQTSLYIDLAFSFLFYNLFSSFLPSFRLYILHLSFTLTSL